MPNEEKKPLLEKNKHKTWCKTFNFNNLTVIINIKGDNYYVKKIQRWTRIL